ncbi:hypothetical protein U9M48_030833 [Paspalum notatum var. saurae]|uniref:Uncharacterized protein n=1 Tax=Paspalum notatum var. saurae TaxID=547442 RepID=A0AAQ3X2N9_PASNO
MAYDMRMEMYQEESSHQIQSSANYGGRGRGGNNHGRGNYRGRGGHGGQYWDMNPSAYRDMNPSASKQGGRNSKPVCQICKKVGHEAPRCWFRYEDGEELENSKTAGAATAGYSYDTNWYADSGATNHNTSELEKLTVRDKYTGRDQV